MSDWGRAKELAQLARKNPSTVISQIPELQELLNHDGHRVRWIAAETLATIAEEYPGEVVAFVPELHDRLNDDYDNSVKNPA